MLSIKNSQAKALTDVAPISITHKSKRRRPTTVVITLTSRIRRVALFSKLRSIRSPNSHPLLTTLPWPRPCRVKGQTTLPALCWPTMRSGKRVRSTAWAGVKSTTSGRRSVRCANCQISIWLRSATHGSRAVLNLKSRAFVLTTLLKIARSCKGHSSRSADVSWCQQVSFTHSSILTSCLGLDVSNPNQLVDWKHFLELYCTFEAGQMDKA